MKAISVEEDDHLNFAFTNAKGCFELKGNEDEYLSIDPYIIVNHQCSNKKIELCSYEFKSSIPDSYISTDKMTSIPYNLTLDLADIPIQKILHCIDRTACQGDATAVDGYRTGTPLTPSAWTDSYIAQ